MRKMNVRKVRRICGVRGCKNIDSYSVSLTREMGNSVIICRDCAGKIVEAIDEANGESPEPVKTETVKTGKKRSD